MAATKKKRVTTDFTDYTDYGIVCFEYTHFVEYEGKSTRQNGKKCQKKGVYKMSTKGQKYRIFNFKEKKFIMEQYFKNGLRISELTEQYGMSETVVREWLKKINYDLSNIEALRHKRYPAEKTRQNLTLKLSDWVKEEIAKLLKTNPLIGPLKIKQYFFRVYQEVISERMIYFYLKEKGIIDKRRKRKETEKKTHSRRFEYPYPLAAVQVDLLTVRLPRKEKIYLVTFLDDYSRFILLSQFISEKTMAEVIKCFSKVIKDYGVMERIIIDKGSEFVSWKSFTKFEEQLCIFDIELIASGPEKPQNQGKVERWHRTYREEFEKNIVRFESMAHAQLETTQFVNYYNFERPHQGIRGLFPADRFFGVSEELEKELAMYRNGKREKECIYFCCNINGKKIVISGPRNGELTIYQNKE
jgi:transposase InsO family protein/transposase-like protein